MIRSSSSDTSEKEAVMKTGTFLSVIILIACFAFSVSGQDAQAEAALRKAAQDGDIQTVKDLIAKGANVNAKDETGKTALLWVAPARDNPEMVKLLIAKGADVNATDNEGVTALMIAASQSNPGILAELIEAGAEINAQNNSGGTALMAAAFRANLDEIKILLAKDADVKLKDKKGRTAFDVAMAGSKNYTDETNKKRFAEAGKLLDLPIN
jgi:ankyrin repeat protein